MNIREKVAETIRQREEQNAVEQLRELKGRMIAAGIGALWEDITSHMKRAAETMKEGYAALPALQIEWTENKPSRQFTIRRKVFPSVTMDVAVDLNSRAIVCTVSQKASRFDEPAGSRMELKLDTDPLGNLIVIDQADLPCDLSRLGDLFFGPF